MVPHSLRSDATISPPCQYLSDSVQTNNLSFEWEDGRVVSSQAFPVICFYVRACCVEVTYGNLFELEINYAETSYP
jgi:hypothetical protein